MNQMPSWGWIAVLAGALYLAYEYLGAECQLPTSDWYGTGICTSLFPAAASSAVSTSAISNPTVPVTSGGTVAQQLAGYGLPADAVPSTNPPGPNCGLVQPMQSGFNPTPGAPFYSPSQGSYMCGPANTWEQMKQGMGGINRVPVEMIHLGRAA
jgi:hypothetical protein